VPPAPSISSSSSVAAWPTTINLFSTLSRQAWGANRTAGDISYLRNSGVTFDPAPSGSESYDIQLNQSGNKLSSGYCYYVEICGSTGGGSRDAQIGFQENGGDYANYFAYDLSFGTYDSCEEMRFLSEVSDADAVLYVNAGYASSTTLTISDISVTQEGDGLTQEECESGEYADYY
jgi:hypothetical protein